MITKESFKSLLLALGFQPDGLLPSRLGYYFPEYDAHLIADFDAQKLIFPESKGLIVHGKQTTNFSQNENFVVFECVFRLLKKGYKPEHIELEPKWKLGHEGKSGRADILVKGNDGKALLIVECKTEGKEFTQAWEDTLRDGAQLFSYAQQAGSTRYVCLYASGLDGNEQPRYHSHLINLQDNALLLEEYQDRNPLTFAGATEAKDLYRVWRETYERDYATQGLFEADSQAYHIGKRTFSAADLGRVGHADIGRKYHEFATILRQHNVAGRENAFDKLVNLFLCKIVDEKDNPGDLKFYWKGIAYDSHFDLQERLQKLYQAGMKEMLNEDVTYIDNAAINDAFRFVRNDPDATRDTIKKYFRQLKFFTNNDFAFIDVHNEKLFYQNAEVLLKLVRMLEGMRLRSPDEPNQFLGDLFEGFLDAGVKQSEGQFFTPIPIVRFLLGSLPLAHVARHSTGPVRGIDYACGAGHFLTELARELRPLAATQPGLPDPAAYDQGLYGIEKEYRLSKVAKVSAFMYGQTGTHIVYADALARHADIQEGSFQVLVANPPYSVKGFLQTLPEAEQQRYALFGAIDKKSLGRNNAIETFFIERARQLLRPGGVAAIVLPSSILSNGGAQYVATRELLLEAFDVVAVAQLGSRTFGKTGTTTATLFLRRKAENPAPAEHYRNRVAAWFRPAEDAAGPQAVYADEPLLRAYCQHQGLSFADYQTLLAGAPSAALLQAELFADYRRDFEKQTDTKKLRASAPFKALTEAEQETRLLRLFTAYLRRIEQDKAYYYVLAAANPQPVVIVKTPDDNQAQKVFLGYDWSGAKGSEGIKYLTGAPAAPSKAASGEEGDAADAEELILDNIRNAENIQSTLYDPQRRDNPAKINYYIERNFLGEDFTVPEELAPHLSTARLVDMLDFGRVGFDKAFSLSPAVNEEVLESPYPLVKLEDIADIARGASPRPIDQYLTTAADGVNWIKIGDVPEGAKFITQTAEKITPEGAAKSRPVRVGDFIVSNSMSFGRPYILQIPGCVHDGWLLLTNFDQRINREYLYEILSSDFVQKQFERQASGVVVRNLNTGIVRSVKIPLPPLKSKRKS